MRTFRNLNEETSDKYYKMILNLGTDLCNNYDTKYEVVSIDGRGPYIEIINDKYHNPVFIDNIDFINAVMRYVWFGLYLTDYQVKELEKIHRELYEKQKTN